MKKLKSRRKKICSRSDVITRIIHKQGDAGKRPFIMEREEFEKLVMKALEDLPRAFKDCLENVDVVIEDMPSYEQAKAVNASHRRMVLGLYQGVPLSRRSHYYGMVMPDKISIFKKNIEKVCSSKKEIVRLVTHTVQHELAHHFGISDQRLKDLGIY
ncbi:MAG: metallopeptidase family protein [Candidatus Omnitrophota bacterium]